MSDLCKMVGYHYIKTHLEVHLTKKKKKKTQIVLLPSSGISENLGPSVRKYFLIIFFFKSIKSTNLGAISTFFLKK